MSKKWKRYENIIIQREINEEFNIRNAWRKKVTEAVIRASNRIFGERTTNN